MEEKGLGVFNYFKTKGIKGTPKELAKAIRCVLNKKNRGVKFDPFDVSISKICKELELKPRFLIKTFSGKIDPQLHGSFDQ